MNETLFNFDNSYLSLPSKLYTKLNPTPVEKPEMVIFNNDLAAELGLDFANIPEQDLTKLFSGNVTPNNTEPFAQAYAGHQFGQFVILGDGRAHILGEHVTPQAQRLDIALKGSGVTPYSRSGDGRAVLGPMLREYIISEAMHALNIPTTRSLAVVATGEPVMRQTALPGAVLTRVAASHIRVGTFEWLNTQSDTAITAALCQYAIERHYPEIKTGNTALEFLRQVMLRQIDLITHWMRVGFIHGVMNTDNMLISGETIDYGPCAFMDTYSSATVFSSVDHMGRYSFGNQPVIAQWNLCRFAEALLPLINSDPQKAVELAKEVISKFPDLYGNKLKSTMCAKLGISKPTENDDQLISDLLTWMQTNKADYTNTFFDLSYTTEPTTNLREDQEYMSWYQRWRERLQQSEQSLEDAQLIMRKHNPTVIPRNHQVEQVLNAAEEGNLQPLHGLLTALKTPYEYSDVLKPYQATPLPSECVHQTYCGT